MIHRLRVTALAPIHVFYSHKTWFFKQSECILYLNFIIGFKQVVFEGIRGNSFTGDIALDDITFTVGMANCSLEPFDALPPGMTTAAPTALTPTTIGK